MQVVTVGRSEENNIVVSDLRARRVHLQVIKDDNGGYSVVDLGSTNGTYVNGVRISSETRLNDGDELKIGSTVLPWKSYFGGAADTMSAVYAHGAGSDANGRKPKKKLVYIIIAVIVLLIIGVVVVWGLRSSGSEGNSDDQHWLDSITIVARENDYKYQKAQADSANAAAAAAKAAEDAANARATADSLKRIAAETKSEDDMKKAAEAEEKAKNAAENAAKAEKDKNTAIQNANNAREELETVNKELKETKNKLEQTEKELQKTQTDVEFYKLLSELNDKKCKTVCENIGINNVNEREAKKKLEEKYNQSNNTNKASIIEKMKTAKGIPDSGQEGSNASQAPIIQKNDTAKQDKDTTKN